MSTMQAHGARCAAVALTLVAALAAPTAAGAAAYARTGCQVEAPDGWVASKTRIASADKRMWASLLSAGTSAEIVSIETGLKATKVSEDGRIILMMSSASYGGQTNTQFHAITKTTPSCVADVTAPAGPQEAAAKAIAMSVKPAR